MRIERRGRAAWIRLNRPERRNAFDGAMARSVVAAIEDCADSGVIVLTGEGRSFCAGGYLARMEDPDPREVRAMYEGSLDLVDAVRTSPRPVIAAVNGAAAGGGNELVVACDLAIASSRATFGQTGPRVGSAPVLGGTNVMSVQIGEKRAKELSFLCRRYTAAEALDMGLVNAVADPDELEAVVEEWAAELLALSPRYLEIAKISSNLWWNSARDSFRSGIGMLAQAVGSADMLEGARAFMEKRPPRFEPPFTGPREH
ncbi:1,4-dihydroxy-2-naphthoyl-CoA synthase [Spinactinospora alkalitolerans]